MIILVWNLVGKGTILPFYLSNKFQQRVINEKNGARSLGRKGSWERTLVYKVSA